MTNPDQGPQPLSEIDQARADIAARELELQRAREEAAEGKNRDRKINRLIKEIEDLNKKIGGVAPSIPVQEPAPAVDTPPIKPDSSKVDTKVVSGDQTVDANDAKALAAAAKNRDKAKEAEKLVDRLALKTGGGEPNAGKPNVNEVASDKEAKRDDVNPQEREEMERLRQQVAEIPETQTKEWRREQEELNKQIERGLSGMSRGTGKKTEAQSIERQPAKTQKEREYESLLNGREMYEGLLKDEGEKVYHKEHKKKLKEINKKIQKYERETRYAEEDYIGTKEYYEEEKEKTKEALQQERFDKDGNAIKNPRQASIDRLEAEIDRLDKKANPSWWKKAISFNWWEARHIKDGIKYLSRKFPIATPIAGVVGTAGAVFLAGPLTLIGAIPVVGYGIYRGIKEAGAREGGREKWWLNAVSESIVGKEVEERTYVRDGAPKEAEKVKLRREVRKLAGGMERELIKLDGKIERVREEQRELEEQLQKRKKSWLLSAGNFIGSSVFGFGETKNESLKSEIDYRKLLIADFQEQKEKLRQKEVQSKTKRKPSEQKEVSEEQRLNDSLQELLTNNPMEGVFDQSKEMRSILFKEERTKEAVESPSKGTAGGVRSLEEIGQREEVKEKYLEKLLTQDKAILLLRSFIAREINKDPNVSPDVLEEYVKQFSGNFGFTEKQTRVVDQLIKRYYEQREKITETRKKYSDDVALVNYLTGLGLKKEDGEKVKIVVGPISIDIKTEDDAIFDVLNKTEQPKIPSDYEDMGFASEKAGVYFNVVKVKKDIKDMTVHERSHQERKIFAVLENKGGKESVGLLRQYEKESNESKKKKFIKDYFDLERKIAFYEVRDELCAIVRQTKELDSPEQRKKLKETVEDLLFAGKDPDYDYLKKIRDDERFGSDEIYQKAAREVLVKKYNWHIERATSAVLELVDAGYSKEDAVMLLSVKELPEWATYVKRLKEIGKKMDIKRKFSAKRSEDQKGEGMTAKTQEPTESNSPKPKSEPVSPTQPTLEEQPYEIRSKDLLEGIEDEFGKLYQKLEKTVTKEDVKDLIGRIDAWRNILKERVDNKDAKEAELEHIAKELNKHFIDEELKSEISELLTGYADKILGEKNKIVL